MSRFLLLGTWLPLMMLQLVGWGTNCSAETKEGKAIVLAIKGNASFSVPGSTELKPVKVGLVLKAGATIKTEADSIVDLDLGANGNSLRIKPSSVLTLTKLTFESTGIDTVADTELELTSGSIIGNVKKVAAASKYEIKTATGVAGIRGTGYETYSNGSVYVSSGTVVVYYYPPGSTTPMGPYTVNAGQMFTPPTGPGQNPVADMPSDKKNELTKDLQLVKQVSDSNTTTTVNTDANGNILDNTGNLPRQQQQVPPPPVS